MMITLKGLEYLNDKYFYGAPRLKGTKDVIPGLDY